MIADIGHYIRYIGHVNDKMELFERINEIKYKLGINTADFARLTGVSPRYITDITSGRSKEPRPSFLAAIVSSTGVSPSWLLTGEGSMFADRDSLEEKPPLNRGSDLLREVFPDVYALYQENQRLKEGKKDCLLCSTMSQLEASRQQEVEKFAKFQLSDQQQAQNKKRSESPSQEVQEPSPLYLVQEEAPQLISIRLAGCSAAGNPTEMGHPDRTLRIDSSLLTGDEREYYAVRIEGTSMIGAGIGDGDYGLIRSASVPINGKIMLIAHGDTLTIKQVKEDPLNEKGRPFHLYYQDGTGREVLAEEDGEDWRIVGEFICTFKPQ